MDHMKYKSGLVLSGGGARGIAHLGAVKALYEEGHAFDVIIGTSMGAIAGSILADGYHPDEIVEMLTPSVLKTFIKTDITKNGLMTMKGGREFLKKILRAKNFEDLRIPFIATATCLNDGRAHYFEKGNIIDAVMASASIPVVFSPVVINGLQYVDGGVLNNLPARFIRPHCKKIAGFHVNPETLGLHNGDVKGIVQIAERTFHLAMLGNVLPDKPLCDFYLEHKNLADYSMLDFTKMKEIFITGYKNTVEALKGNKTL